MIKFKKPIGEPTAGPPHLRNSREPEALDPDSFPPQVAGREATRDH